MTAEVAIMNEHVIVLAADSATTVSMWIGGERKTRYFRGANKLFQLSRGHPVGLMIHGVCQGGCRLTYAAIRVLSAAFWAALIGASRSGLSVTTPIGSQLRV